MKAFIPKIDFKNVLPDGRIINFSEYMVYIIPNEIAEILKIMFVGQGYDPDMCFILTDVEKVFRPYNHNDNNKNIVPVIVRSGGIGDLIALSSLTWFLSKITYNKTLFICDGRFKDVFKFYRIKPHRVLDHFEPLCRFTSLSTNFYRLINLEGICEENPRKNWYEKFYERMFVPFEKDFGHPYLLPVKNNYKGIVILNKATSYMRSISLPVIINALQKAGFKKERFILFQKNLSDEDYKYLSSNFFIENPINLFQFLTSLYHSGKIISVDTAGIHFFEGIKKPGLGLYSSFTTESRTKYYQYTRSIDIQSSCDLQPCFLHDKKAGDQCPKMLPGETDAPCMGRLSTNLTEQLINNLIQWKSTF